MKGSGRAPRGPGVHRLVAGWLRCVSCGAHLEQAPEPAPPAPVSLPMEEEEIDGAAASRLMLIGGQLDQAVSLGADTRRLAAAVTTTERIYRLLRELSGLPTTKPPLIGELLPDCWIRLRRLNAKGEVEVEHLAGPGVAAG